MPGKKSKTKKGAARRRAAPSRGLNAALAEAAWAEADAALAEALAEFDALAGGDTDAADLLRQALQRAARKRGLSRICIAGATEAYDPNRHQLIKPIARRPAKVRIRIAGIARGEDILVRARVTPVRQRAK